MVSSRSGIRTGIGWAAVVLAALPWCARAQEKVPPPAAAARKPPSPLPPVEIIPGPAQGTATPRYSCRSAHAGGGNITVTRLDPATVAITMTGVAVAKGDDAFHEVWAGYEFAHAQCFEVVFNSPDVKSARLVLEGTVLGRLRTYCECPEWCKRGGIAQITTPASAVVRCGPAEIMALHLPARQACCCDSQTVHDHQGPLSVPVLPGKYTLHEQFGFVASAPCSALLTRFAAADFSPEWVLDLRPLGFPEPFIPYGNKDFGFTVILKVVPE